MYRKNRSATLCFTLIDKDTGEYVSTGNVTARIVQDGSLHTTSTLTPGSNFISGTSMWQLEISTSAMNGDVISIGLTHADAVPQTHNINTFEYDTQEIYNGITTLLEGVTVAVVGASSVTGISDFHVNTTGLSTFDSTTDFVTFGVPDVNIISVADAGVTIGDFRATGITASVSGIVQANVVQVATSGISDVVDLHVNTTGLSTFDSTSDFVNVGALGITAGGLATSAITKIVNGIFDQVVDGSITFDTIMEMLLAWMAGKVDVTDNGTTRTISFYKRDGTTESFNITVDETDSQEGRRNATGTVN